MQVKQCLYIVSIASISNKCCFLFILNMALSYSPLAAMVAGDSLLGVLTGVLTSCPLVFGSSGLLSEDRVNKSGDEVRRYLPTHPVGESLSQILK